MSGARRKAAQALFHHSRVVKKKMLKSIYMEADNCVGVLRRIAGVIDKKGYNIETVNAKPLIEYGERTGKTEIKITLNISDRQAAELNKLLRRLYDIEVVEKEF